VRRRLFDSLEVDLREASGLIAPDQHDELFRRYLHHVRAFVKGESLRHPLTGRDEPPDARLMTDVEALLGVSGEPRAHRDGLLSRVAAWVIEHPDAEARPTEIFAVQIERMRAAAHERLRQPFARLLRDLVRALRDGESTLEATARRDVASMHEHLLTRGYDADSAAEAASALLRERYADLVV
jgi:predicted Ser/Thr protein kinase